MKKISDPIFGDLYYQDLDDNDVSKLDKLTGRVCHLPFSKIMVCNSGDVIICCPQWLPAVIGNVLTESIQDIWAGKKANIIRESINDGSYKYCDKKVCHYIHHADTQLALKEHFNITVKTLPTDVIIAVDTNCNLHCPSCRSDKVTLNKEESEVTTRILMSVFNSLFYAPHNEPLNIEIDGVGDIFASPIYRQLFETEKCFTNPELWPKLRWTLLTNGVMLTEKIQKKYETILSTSSNIKISIDAGNKQSYDKVRLGGNWDILLKNLDYLYESRLKHPDNTIEWYWVVVLQEDNFESIPELIQLANKYPNKLPHIHLHPIMQGLHMADFIFRKKAVWMETSERYARLLEVLNLPEVVGYTNLYKPF